MTGAFGGNRFHQNSGSDPDDDFWDRLDSAGPDSDDSFDDEDGWLREASARRSRKIRRMGIAMAVALGIPLLAGAVATLQRIRSAEPPPVSSIRVTFVTTFDANGCVMVNGARWSALEPLPTSADPRESARRFVSGTLTFAGAGEATFMPDTGGGPAVVVRPAAKADRAPTNGPAVGCDVP